MSRKICISKKYIYVSLFIGTIFCFIFFIASSNKTSKSTTTRAFFLKSPIITPTDVPDIMLTLTGLKSRGFIIEKGPPLPGNLISFTEIGRGRTNNGLLSSKAINWRYSKLTPREVVQSGGSQVENNYNISPISFKDNSELYKLGADVSLDRTEWANFASWAKLEFVFEDNLNPDLEEERDLVVLFMNSFKGLPIDQRPDYYLYTKAAYMDQFVDSKQDYEYYDNTPSILFLVGVKNRTGTDNKSVTLYYPQINFNPRIIDENSIAGMDISKALSIKKYDVAPGEYHFLRKLVIDGETDGSILTLLNDEDGVLRLTRFK